MIILDTNVISEAMRPEAEPAVKAWLNNQTVETLYLSDITLAEILFGLHTLPGGKRKTALREAFNGLLTLFGGRILPFDTDAAYHYGELAAAARGAGHGLPVPDGYLAAIAASRGFAVASRDTGPFEAAGLRVINPWL